MQNASFLEWGRSYKRMCEEGIDDPAMDKATFVDKPLPEVEPLSWHEVVMAPKVERLIRPDDPLDATHLLYMFTIAKNGSWGRKFNLALTVAHLLNL